METEANNAKQQAMARAMIALDGLSVGDAFGECFFSPAEVVTSQRMAEDLVPEGIWRWTDDTAMACGVMETLRRWGGIDQDRLAEVLGRRYEMDPRRGYGATAQVVLRRLAAGHDWREVAPSVFSGMGSLGNGSAMRVAPLGAWYADSIPLLIDEARKSAEVTHAHIDGVAGAIAVALAAAFALNHQGKATPRLLREFFEFVLDGTPDSMTRAGIVQAMDLPRSYSLETAAQVLGNGHRITCPDTVPVCMWLAARHWADYKAALWSTCCIGGDVDTTCAIVGGIVVLSCQPPELPETWLRHREELPLWI